MDQTLDASWSVGRILAVYPQTAPVFKDFKLNCAGCVMERFCRLEEAAFAYEVPLEPLLEKLRVAANPG